MTTTTTVGSGADLGIAISIDFGMISEIGKFVGISSSLIWKRQIIYLRYLEKGLKNKAYILERGSSWFDLAGANRSYESINNILLDLFYAPLEE